MNQIKSCTIVSWTYPSNWLRNAKEIYNFFKRRFQRGRDGVSSYDAWSLDSYMLQVFKNGLAIFKEENNAYPGCLTEQEWENILNRMTELINIIQIDGIDCEEANKYYDKDNKRWYAEVKKWDVYRQECWEELCDIMKEWFFHLWW